MSGTSPPSSSNSPPPNSPVAATPPSTFNSPPPSTSNSPPPSTSNSPPPSTFNSPPPSTSNSPPPNSPVAATPPSTTDSPPPQSPPPPPLTPSALPPQANAPPPQPPSAPPPQLNSPPRSPPPITVTSPPQMASPPPTANAPPPTPPVANAPPPQPNPPPPTPPVANAPPPQVNVPPPTANAPPLQANAPPPTPPIANAPPPQANAPPLLPSSPPSTSPPPPANSPPPPTPPLPPNSPPPPVTNPRPPPSRPPNNAPPPPEATPPRSSPPPVINPRPPPPRPPNNAPPPPTPTPPRSSPPPRQPPNNSPPTPPNPPESSTPPPTEIPQSPPPPVVPPPKPATPPVPSRSSSSPPSPPISPPPPSTVPSPHLSPPSPSLDPPGNTNTNNSSDNAPEVSQSPSSGGIGTGGTVGIVVALSLLLLGVFGIVAFFVWKRKKKASGHNVGHIMPTSISSSPASESGLLKLQISKSSNGSGLGNSRSWFTYDELVEATDGFSDQKLLGEGGFGSVYKGSLADGREVAVKLLKSCGGQGEREFRSEVEIISRVHHRHLVSLVGYCISGERRLLVFDYLSNDTLYFHLHGEGRPVMDWATRVKIAVGAARGISYLHEDCHPRIIHRDIKSSNILLDNNFEARVSDFGLAKLAMDANTHISTRVMGTFGYMAPEYASSGKLTEKSDVYSFGVVLLELITGRKPVDTSQPLGDESLVEWARPLLSDALETQDFGVLADPRLNGNFVAEEMFRLIEAAAACVRHSSAKRPTMGQVVRAFDSMATSDLTNGMRVGESEIFNSAQQSAEIRLFQRMAFGNQDYSTDFFSQNSRGSEGNRETSRRI